MFCADNNLWNFKGKIPLIEGNYRDYTGEQKKYTSRVKGEISAIPNDWTLYQFMANSARAIKDDRGKSIILPTRKGMTSVWKNTPAISSVAILEAEKANRVNGFNIGQSTGKRDSKGKEIRVGKIRVSNEKSSSNGQKVGNVGWGNTLEFTYNSRQACTSYFEVAYATAEKRDMNISVNGKPPLQITCEKTGGYNDFTTKVIEIPLKAGINRFVIGGPADGWAPDLDYFTFSRKKKAAYPNK